MNVCVTMNGRHLKCTYAVDECPSREAVWGKSSDRMVRAGQGAVNTPTGSNPAQLVLPEEQG